MKPMTIFFSALTCVACYSSSAPIEPVSVVPVSARPAAALTPTQPTTPVTAKTPTKAPIALESFMMKSELDGVGLDTKHQPYQTHDGARTWQKISAPFASDDSLSSIELSGSELWVLTSQTTEYDASPAPINVWHSTDSGETWQHQALPTADPDEDYFFSEWVDASLSVVDTKHAWALLTQSPGMNHHESRLYRTDDGGKSWSLVNSEQRLQDVSFTSAKDGMGVTFYTPVEPNPVQDLVATHDGGKTWSIVKLPGVKPKTYLGIFSSYQLPSKESSKYASLVSSVSSSTDDANIGYGVFSSFDGGKTWGSKFVVLPERVLDIEVYASPDGSSLWSFRREQLDDGADGPLQVHQSADNGKTWKPIFTGQTLGGFDASQAYFYGFQPINQKVGFLAMAPQSSDEDNPAITILVTKDGGASWEKLSPSLK